MDSGRTGSFESAAAIVTVLSCLLTVTYAAGPVDAWDLAVASLVLFVCYSYRTELFRAGRVVAIARIGIAVAFTIIAGAILFLICPSWAASLHCVHLKLFDGYFMLAVVFFLLTFVIYRRPPIDVDIHPVALSPETATANVSEIKSDELPSTRDARLGRLLQHAVHEETNFYNRLNIFSVFETLLLTAYASVASSARNLDFLKILIPLVAFIVACLWCYSQARSHNYVQFLVKHLKVQLPEFADRGAFRPPTAWTATVIMTYSVPIIFILVWLAIIVHDICGRRI
jgi:hypothetical protein